MAAEIVYQPQDDRGKAILDELEQRTQGSAPADDVAPDARRYYANSGDVHAHEPMLDSIDPNWREHVVSLTSE